MKHRLSSLTLFLLVTAGLPAQDYRLDNKVYETISWNEFFNRLERNPNLVYFDIRTAGERYDTSQYAASNQGRIRGARQIDYYQFDRYYAELLKHKQDTIYLYCSHSMRSRRLAKQLADSSFKRLVSINGGMSYLNLMGEKTFPLRRKYYETSIRYKLVSPQDFGAKLHNRDVQVVDVRPDSIYFASGGDEQDRSYGRIPGVRHIPEASISDSIGVLDKNREIVLVDNYGDLSGDVANRLLDHGFKDVGVLFFGLEELRSTVASDRRKYLELTYPSILPDELLALRKTGELVIIDIRTASEFTSTDTVKWKNVGRLKDAVNIPLAELSPEKLRPFHGKFILLYDNRMIPPELYQAADILKQMGTERYALLSGGVFQIIWEIANTDKQHLKVLLDPGSPQVGK